MERMEQREPLNHFLDRALVFFIAVLGALTLCLLPFASIFVMPSGDVDILFQYSLNLAHHGAITFIPMGPHAEGATDFAWMVLISLGIKLGIEPLLLVELFSTAALIGLAVLLIKIAGEKLKPLPVLFIAGSFALMPQIFSAMLGFSTLPFAFLLVLLVYCFLNEKPVALPLTALFLCLFRPDGVVFAVPVMIAALIASPNKARQLLLDISCFLVPGLLYFFWRWHYFGHLFPLPFLVKSNTPRIHHIFVASSLYEGRNICWFSGIILLVALFGHIRVQRNRSVLLCLVVLPTLFYFAMRLDQNTALRFFTFLPVGTAVLIAMNWNALRLRLPFLLKLALVAGTFFLLKTWVNAESLVASHRPQQAKEIGEELGRLPKGTLITTEAGELPYYSQWTSYDAWGLDTPEFATRLFQPSDVAAIRPDLILAFTNGRGLDTACIPQADWHAPYKERVWQNMTRNIVSGIDSSKYEFWLAPVNNARFRAQQHLASWQGEQFCLWVRRDSPLRSGIEAVLARHAGVPFEEYVKLNSTAFSSQIKADHVNMPQSIGDKVIFFSHKVLFAIYRRLPDGPIW